MTRDIYQHVAEEICQLLKPRRNVPYSAVSERDVTPEAAVEAILRRDLGFVIDCLDMENVGDENE